MRKLLKKIVYEFQGVWYHSSYWGFLIDAHLHVLNRVLWTFLRHRLQLSISLSWIFLDNFYSLLSVSETPQPSLLRCDRLTRCTRGLRVRNSIVVSITHSIAFILTILASTISKTPPYSTETGCCFQLSFVPRRDARHISAIQIDTDNGAPTGLFVQPIRTGLSFVDSLFKKATCHGTASEASTRTTATKSGASAPAWGKDKALGDTASTSANNYSANAALGSFPQESLPGRIGTTRMGCICCVDFYILVCAWSYV